MKRLAKPVFMAAQQDSSMLFNQKKNMSKAECLTSADYGTSSNQHTILSLV